MRRLVAAFAIAVGLGVAPAHAAFTFSYDLVCETTSTAGTGTLDLAGAATGYLGFIAAGVPTGSTVPYHIRNGSQFETGIGTVTDGTPDTLARTSVKFSTDGVATAITLSGSSTVCLGPISSVWPDSDHGDITTSAGFQTWTIDDNAIALGTKTTGNYVADITAGTAIDVSGGGSETATVTVDWDSTEVEATTWGAGGNASNIWTFDLSGTDQTLTFGSASLSLAGAFTASTDVTATAGDVTSGDDVIVGDDVLIASGGVINWASGDCLWTHSSNTLALTGSCVITSDSSLELSGNASATLTTSSADLLVESKIVKRVGKQTIWIPAGAMYGDVTNPASCGDTYDSGSNDLTLKVCAFDTGATEERADFTVAFPKNWDEGTVTAQFFWTNTGGASSSVAWEIGCVAIPDDDTLNATIGTTQTTVDAWIATNDLHVSAESSAITCAGTPAAGDQVFFRINRDTSNGSDAMAGDALLTGIKLYFTDDAANDD